MNTVVSNDPRIEDVCITDDEIVARLAGGRILSVPLACSWRLSDATPKQRANWHLIGAGQGVHWPDVDEDLSVEGLLHGVPAHRPASAKRIPGTRSRKAPNKRMQPTRKSVARG